MDFNVVGLSSGGGKVSSLVLSWRHGFGISKTEFGAASNGIYVRSDRLDEAHPFFDILHHFGLGTVEEGGAVFHSYSNQISGGTLYVSDYEAAFYYGRWELHPASHLPIELQNFGV